MSVPTYPLETLLSAISKYKNQRATKRTLFNQAPLGGLSSAQLILFFISLPFIEFAVIFNPVVFNSMGIAQSIVAYIVFMSIIMMIAFLMSWRNNTKVIKKITPSWESYFPNVDLKMVLSSGHTPFKDFFRIYTEALNSDIKGTGLHQALQKGFATMREENKELLEAIERDKKI